MIEVDKKFRTSPKKYFSEKKVYPMIFFETNKENTVIKISQRQLKENIREKHLAEFDYYSRIYRLTSEIAFLGGALMNDVLPYTMWMIAKKDAIENSKDAYNVILSNPMKYIEELPDTFDKNVIFENIEGRINRTNMTIHQEFELIVTCDNAITILKNILNYNDDGVEIEYVNAPKYRVVAVGKDEYECNNIAERCIRIIHDRVNAIGERVIFKLGWNFTAKEREMTIKYLPRRENS